jgi:AcrR family transcriptional regulator
MAADLASERVQRDGQAPRGSLRERKKRETRARIVHAARALFQEQGFEATTVDQIAEAANVSRQTCFNYFHEKSAILTLLGDAMEETFQERIEEVRALDAPTGERLAALLVGSAERLLESPDLSRLLLMETVATRRDLDDRRSRTARMHDGIASLLRDGIARGDVRRDLPLPLLSSIATGAFTENLVRWLVEPDYPLAERLRQTAAFLAPALAPID